MVCVFFLPEQLDSDAMNFNYHYYFEHFQSTGMWARSLVKKRKLWADKFQEFLCKNILIIEGTKSDVSPPFCFEAEPKEYHELIVDTMLLLYTFCFFSSS